jgi:hypothetical protein
MSKRKDEKNSGAGFVTILEWMVNDLGLSGNSLLIYAIVYGFSQGDRQEFTGTHQYLAHWTGTTVRSVINNLKSLLEMGYIVKGEREYKGQISPTYKAVIPDVFGVKKFHTPPVKNFHTPCEKISHPPVKNFHTPCEKISPQDNIGDNIYINNNNIYNPPYNPPLGDNHPEIVVNDGREKSKRNGPFVPPSVEEVQAYCDERKNGINAQRFVDYYTSVGWTVGKGKKMVDWKAAVRTWDRQDEEKKHQSVKDDPKGSFSTDEFFSAAFRRSYDDFLESGDQKNFD